LKNLPAIRLRCLAGRQATARVEGIAACFAFSTMNAKKAHHCLALLLRVLHLRRMRWRIEWRRMRLAQVYPPEPVHQR